MLIIFRLLLELLFKFCFERDLVRKDLGFFILGCAFGKTLSGLTTKTREKEKSAGD